MALAFENLTLSLRGRRVLDGVSGRFEAGRVTVILGANGAGKSTLLDCLAGQRQPDSGQVLLDEVPIMTLDRRERARAIGLLPQKADIHWDVDVRTLVSLGRLPHAGRWGLSAADLAAIESAMVATDSLHLASRTALRLSGGEQGRVLLARALAGEPRWLLADEPLASLDPAHQIDSLDRLKACARAGSGVIVVLHDLTQAARIADEVIVLAGGRILASGEASGVLDENILGKAYGVTVHIAQGPSGERLIAPLDRL